MFSFLHCSLIICSIMNVLSMSTKAKEIEIKMKSAHKGLDMKQMEQNVIDQILRDHLCLMYLIKALINERRQRMRIEDHWTFRQGR
jgi:hypothetical protein